MACGYYLPYPDSPHEGLVTKTSNHLPIMNWLYIDSTTYRLHYGIRNEAEGNITGPFDCTDHSRRVTLFKWEGWCAVEEQSGQWAVYFDIDDDGLHGKVPLGTRVLEIELERREERYKKAEHGVAHWEGIKEPIAPEPANDEVPTPPAAGIEPPLTTKPLLPEPLDIEPSKPQTLSPQVPPPIDSRKPPRPRRSSMHGVGSPIMDRPRMMFESQPSAIPPLRISEWRPNHGRPPPAHYHPQSTRPSLQIGQLPFESRLQKSSSSNPIRPQSPYKNAVPPTSRPRFQSLDISRKDVQRQERIPTDSSVQSTWSRQVRTSSADSSAGYGKAPGKKPSIKDRVSKALKGNFRNERLFAADI